MKTSSLLVSLVVRDRVGILRDATGALFRLGGNILDVRQNVVGGLFTLNALVRFEDGADPEAVRTAVLGAVPDAGTSIAIHEAREDDAPAPGTYERYVAALSGVDRPGWIHRASAIFAQFGANVEDWRHDRSVPERTLTIGVVSVPTACDLPALRKTLSDTFAPDGISVSLLQENIFRATNEVGPISQLLDPASERISRNA